MEPPSCLQIILHVQRSLATLELQLSICPGDLDPNYGFLATTCSTHSVTFRFSSCQVVYAERSFEHAMRIQHFCRVL